MDYKKIKSANSFHLHMVDYIEYVHPEGNKLLFTHMEAVFRGSQKFNPFLAFLFVHPVGSCLVHPVGSCFCFWKCIKTAFEYIGKRRLHSGSKLHLFTLETRKIFRYFYVIRIAEKAML
jgi:hypothetical protein